MASNINSATTVAYINTSVTSRTIFLPSTFNIEGKFVTVKDSCNNAGSNPITIGGLGGDLFEGGISNITINQNFGFASFVAHNGVWHCLAKSAINNDNFNTPSIGSNEGVSSLSSIVAYGLSTLSGGQGISSLSSIVAYGLSTLSGGQGISSLSSIVAYGLSTVSGGQGISSLSSIVAYGLSTVSGGQGISSLSSIVAYGLSTLERQPAPGVSSLSSIVAYGLSSINAGQGVSSLSSIVSYGLSTVSGGQGISSLSSIVAYGLSCLREYVDTCNSRVENNNGGNGSNEGVSSLSSIVAYGLSSLWSPDGISSLSSIVAYGLSSLTQSSLTVTTIGAMTLYGKGGVGLSTINTAPADTITNAFAKVDNWLFKNLVDQPPAPVSNVTTQSSNTGFFIYQTFDAPFQFKSAFIPNMWLPSIFSLNINIFDSNLSNISCNITDPIYLPRGSCNLAGFYFDTYIYQGQQIFPFTYNTISNLMYINIYSNIPNILKNPYTINIFYSNYSAEPVHNLTSIWTIFRGGAPSAPYDLEIDSLEYDSFNTLFTLSNSDTVNTNNDSLYTNSVLTIHFDTPNYPRRYNLDTIYYDNYSNTCNYNINGCNEGDRIRVKITNLPADTSLYFNTYANNFYANSNGELSSNSAPVRTLLPPLRGDRLYNITFTGKLLYQNYGIIYSNDRMSPISPVEVLCNSLINNNRQFVIYLNTNTPENSKIQLHTQTNPGSSNSNIAYVELILDNVDSNIYYFDGFPNNIEEGDKTSSDNSQLYCGNIQDSYLNNSNLSNFYLNINKIHYYIFPTYFSAQAEPHTFSVTLSNENLPNCNVSGQIYSDTLQVLPSINNILNYRNISNDGTYKYVSGLLVLSNNVTFDLNVDVGNFAQYFYPAVNIFGSVSLSYDGISASVSSNIYSNVTIYDVNDSSVIGVIAPNPARFKLSNIDFSPTNDFLWTNGDIARENRIEANVNNLTNIVGEVETISYNLQYYFDSLSLSNIDNNLASPKSIGGLRMETVGNNYDNIFNPYDHTQQIINNSINTNYNNEIPLLGGFHSVGSAIATNYNYINNFLPVAGFPQYNYPDYSEIGSDGSTRYATFKYSLSNSGPNFVKLLEFNFNNYADIDYDNTNTNCNFNPSIVPILWYKIDNSGPYNTGWLDGNVTKLSYLPFNSGNSGNGEVGLRSNDIYTPIDGAKRYFSIIPIPSSCNFDVYVNIGLANTGKFDYIKIGLSNGSTPAAPTGITLSQTYNNESNFNLTAEWTNPTGYGPIISNRVVACNVIVAGYPSRWVSAGNEYFNNTVTCNVNVESSTFPVINANTYYDVFVKSLNDIDFGLTGSERILTAFPSTDVPFYDTSKLINMNTSYYNYCNAIPFGLNTPIQNIQNYNTVMSGSFINFNIGTQPITFNYESNQAGSNLSKMTLYIRGTVNATTTVSQFQFNNSLYSNTSLTTVDGSNGVGLTLQLSNLTDKYPNASWPTISGFYYTGKVFFSASNTFVTPSKYGYSFILSNSSGSNLPSSTYYFDNLTTNAVPTINSVFVDTTNITDYWTYVSGILTFKSTCNYNFWIQASNLGSNFYRNPPVRVTLSNSSFITNFPFVPGTTKFYSTCNIANELTSVANSQNNTYFNWLNVSIEQSYTFSNSLRVNASASNLNDNGINSNFDFMDVAGGKLFFDSASVLLRDNTKNSNYVSGATNYGLRVESGFGAYPNWNQTGATDDSLFGFSNNDNTLLTGPYTNELQIVNGAYVGSNANCNYSAAFLYTPPGESYSYPNYSGVYTTDGTRYATFMWYVSGTGIQYKTAQFNMNGNNFTNVQDNSITRYTNNITLQYLSISLGFTSIWPPNQNDNATTAWQDGNKSAAAINTNRTRCTNDNPGAIKNFNTAITRRINLSFGDSTGRTPLLLFVRVGLPVASNFSFNNVQLISLSST